MITLIAALDLNGGIGSQNAIPWRTPEDLKRFKALTIGHPIIMGRRTFESIGHPLPDRENIVVSRRTAALNGCHSVPTLETAFILAKQMSADGQIFVIGGGEIFAQTLAAADQLLLTVVRWTYTCDTRFPADLGRDWLVMAEGQVPERNGNPALVFLRLEPCVNAARARWNGLQTAQYLRDVCDFARHLPLTAP